MGCDLAINVGVHKSTDFNPRTHVGCDTHCLTFFFGFSNFNPRTHVGCDSSRRWQDSPECISIHAPTWGATNFVTEMLSATNISIHAPTWGATSNSEDTASWTIFQSTHPRGVRRRANPGSNPKRYFNPRTHVGCDKLPSEAALKCSIFQSTHPRGVRHALPYVLFQFCLFQSTHPRGVRPLGLHNRIAGGSISIHAPTWGATIKRAGRLTVSINFNPRTHVGCDSNIEHQTIQFVISIHAPTWGATKTLRQNPL